MCNLPHRVITKQTYPTQTSILSTIKFGSSDAFQPLHFCCLFVIGCKIFFSVSFDQFVVYGAPHAVFMFMWIRNQYGTDSVKQNSY